MFFATRDNKEVEVFWLPYFMMTSDMKDCFLEDNEQEVKKVFRETIDGTFEHDLYIKPFNNQLEPDEMDTLQQRNDWWMMVVGTEVQYLRMLLIITLANCLVDIVKL